jgi:hypothetical protein
LDEAKMSLTFMPVLPRFPPSLPTPVVAIDKNPFGNQQKERLTLVFWPVAADTLTFVRISELQGQAATITDPRVERLDVGGRPVQVEWNAFADPDGEASAPWEQKGVVFVADLVWHPPSRAKNGSDQERAQLLGLFSSMIQ